MTEITEKIFPGLLEILNVSERTIFIEKLQVILLTHIINKVKNYSWMAQMNKELIDRCRAVFYKYSQRSKAEFLNEQVFVFMTLFYFEKNSARASIKVSGSDSFKKLKEEAKLSLDNLAQTDQLTRKLKNYLGNL